MKRKDDVLPERLIRDILAASHEQAGVMPHPGVRERLLAAIGSYPPGLRVVKSREGEWRTLAPGVSAKVLRDDGRTCTWLGRMEPGASFPAHDHPVDEECLVLEGDMEADGVSISAGDYQIALAGTRHGAVRSRGGCVVLIRSASF